MSDIPPDSTLDFNIYLRSLENRRAFAFPRVFGERKKISKMQDNTEIQEKREKLPRLPNEMLCCIFAFLSTKDLFLGAARGCKKWKAIVDSGTVLQSENWKKKVAEPSFTKHRALGRECFDKEQWEEAIKHFGRALILNPRDHLSYFWRAYSFAESGKYRLALQDFTRSLELDPQDATTYSNRGATYRDIGEHELALKDLQMAIKLDPESASAHNNRGVVFGDLGKIEEAVSEYSQALEIDPNHLIALRNRGRRYQKMGKVDMAHQDFTKLLKLDAKDNEALRFFIGCEVKGLFGYSKPKILDKKEVMQSD